MSGIPTAPPSRSLQGRVAIVTGAGSEGNGIGNGRAITILLASDGCNVIALDVDLERATRTAEMANSEPSRGLVIPARGDVTSSTDCESAVQLALGKFGRLDILVNNVGVIGATGTAIEVDMAQWAKGLEINVSSMVQMTKYAVPAMVRNPSETKGSIINMGSIAGLRGGKSDLLYPTTKGAVVNMTRAMAANHGKDGIRVNCVCPGALYTPMMYAGGMTEEARAARKGSNLLGTEGNGWDTACAVVFLASDHSRWITGLIMPVDAGATTAGGISMMKAPSANG